MPGRTTPSARRLVRALALAALCGLVAYAAIDAALNFLPPHYSVISNAESDYGVGPYGWLMDANFVLRGLLSLAVAVAAAVARAAVRPAGARRRAGASVGLALLALWGVASLLLAFLPTSLEGRPITPSGAAHLVVAGVAFAAAAAGESLITPRLRETPAWSGSGTWLVVLNAGAWLFLLLNLVAVRQAARGHGLGHLDGLIERLFLLCVLGWLAAAAAGLVRGRGAGARPAGPCG